ncbi:MAG: hypothetical protein E7040_10690, partial [Lentisphaerae bacterium]|nr:hypothetical protein [Lentisphaerota bacterium]
MNFLKSTLTWYWKYYVVPADFELKDGEFVGDRITLDDGSVAVGEQFKFQEDFQVNILGKADRQQKLLYVGNFYPESSGEIFIGFAVASGWNFRFNGKMRICGWNIGNNEYPMQFNNHIAELDYLPGRNQVVFELRGDPNSMLLMLKIMDDMKPLSMKYGPFVSFPDSSENAVSVIFAGTRNSPAAVEYREKGCAEWTRINDNLGGQMRHDRPMHHIRLEDLKPDCDYEYRAILIDDCKELEEIIPERIETFRTAPQGDKAYSFLLTADLQNVPHRMEYLERMLGKNKPFNPDFFAFAGDMLWTSNFNQSIMDEFIEPYRKYTDNKLPLVMVRGNHEIYGKESNHYFDYFTPPCEGREGYYMFRWGDTCFIVLDFCDDYGWIKPPSTRQFHDFEPYIAAEAKWLKKAVELPICKDAKYRIVLAHGVPVGDTQEYMPSHVRQVIDPVFSGAEPKVRIHLWLGGHIHRPFRSIPLTNSCYSMVDVADFAEPHP